MSILYKIVNFVLFAKNSIVFWIIKCNRQLVNVLTISDLFDFFVATLGFHKKQRQTMLF